MADVVHGGLRAEEVEALGLDAMDVVDLSANLNPLGPHTHVLTSAREADLRHYPEPHSASLRAELARFAHVESTQVLVTPGSTAALHLIARAFLGEGDECIIWPPTFGEYTAAIASAMGAPREYRSEAPEFGLDTAIDPAPLGILCNPNNPTGQYVSRQTVEEISDRLHGLLVMDVAYDPFVQDAWDADELVRGGRDVLIVHSMTKLHAVPGIRLGYVIGPADRIQRLAGLLPSWSVDATAQAAGRAMIAVDGVQRQAVVDVARVRGMICGELAAAGIKVVEGRANFLIVRVGDAAGVRSRLLSRGFAVRDCASFGLPEWIRIAVPVDVAARRLLGALLTVLKESHP